MSEKTHNPPENSIIWPICPFCKSQMSIAKYEGYYDTFKYWTCNCHSDDLPEEGESWCGQYVG